MSASDGGRRLDTLRFAILVALLVGCFLMGGASRVDVLSLVVLQPFAVFCIGIFILLGRGIRWNSIKVPLLLLGALASIMAVQLIPLPPELWMALPGHGQFAAPAQVAGLPQPWRPISLTPDLTLNSLVSLSIPLAVFVGFASLSPERTRELLPYVLGGAVLSAVLGLAQLAGGGRGALYLYDVTNAGSAVGLFANRNHQAVLLAMAWPMLAVWVGHQHHRHVATARPLIALALGLFFLPMTLVTGSRAGLGLAVIGVAAAFFIWRGERGFRALDRKKALVAAAILLVAIGVVMAAILFSRDEALERTSATTLSQEVRFASLPTILQILYAFFPIGAGFGSFDAVFRVYEPLALLSPLYLNHAHNDLVELVLVGGLPAIVVLVCFFVWLIKGALRVLGTDRGATSLAFARLGLAMIAILLFSSLVDYPLRTPLLAALFALACGWFCDHSGRQRDELQDGHH